MPKISWVVLQFILVNFNYTFFISIITCIIVILFIYFSLFIILFFRPKSQYSELEEDEGKKNIEHLCDTYAVSQLFRLSTLLTYTFDHYHLRFLVYFNILQLCYHVYKMSSYHCW